MSERRPRTEPRAIGQGRMHSGPAPRLQNVPNYAVNLGEKHVGEFEEPAAEVVTEEAAAEEPAPVEGAPAPPKAPAKRRSRSRAKPTK